MTFIAGHGNDADWGTLQGGEGVRVARSKRKDRSL